MYSHKILVPILLVFIGYSHCQLNRIKPVLVQCYNETAIPGVTIANNRPPATLNIFLEIIRRLEDANPNLSARDLSVVLLQRLRQDGIMSTAQTVSSSFAIPFGISRPESYKTTEILRAYIQNTSSVLNFGDLQPRDICTFHYIISSTINDRARGDESTTCTRSARYTSRLRRDAEVIDAQPTTEADIENVADTFDTRALSVGSYDISQCPLELGVVLTNYGTIKGGQVLAGIATGFNQQTFESVDNRYAATIAGEIAEAALSQGEKIQIGAQGGWNSTINPRYFFLERNTALELTDAEIRGSLDGLYMALRLDNWKTYDIKISQIIDMYYTPYQKGVLESTFRACNRNILYTEMTSADKMKKQIQNFLNPLDSKSDYGLTFDTEIYPALTELAYNSFVSYLPQMNTKDPSCVPEEKIERVAADLMIFVDFGWNYDSIRLILSNILDNLDVSRFGTRYTIFNGVSGNNVTSNRTTHLLDFHNQFNLTTYQKYPAGFEYVKVYDVLEGLARQKLDNSTYFGADSTVALLIPRTPPNEAQRINLLQRRDSIRQTLPDLNVLVLGAGSQVDYSSIILNQDFTLLSDTTNENEIKTIGRNVVTRIKSVNRVIVNPSCGSTFRGSARTISLTEYVEIKGVNYYSIKPHYFYRGEGTRNLKVTENSYGAIQVCISRNQAKPSNNTDTCQTIRSNVHTTDISSFCSGSLTDCAPIYISVEGVSTSTRCIDSACRYPDNIKYTLSLENVGCASSSFKVIANFLVVATVLLIIWF